VRLCSNLSFKARVAPAERSLTERVVEGGPNVMNRPRRVLVVDDDRSLCEMLRVVLELEGLEVVTAHHVIEAEKRLAEAVPDVLVLDVGLPGIDGVFYCERLRESLRTRRLPIIAISGSEEAGRRARLAGANAVLIKPLDPLHLLATVDKLCAARGEEGQSEMSSPDILRLIEIGQRQLDALESRHAETSAHSRRVSAYATKLTLELDPSLLDDPTVEWGFLLHDIGKIGIPDHVLLKPGPLDTAERRCVETHPLIGHRLVAHIPFVQGRGIEVIRSHHERWDGRGYPDGLEGERIPFAARIFAVADALDAMTDARPYRDPIRWADAISEIVRMRGTQFDPDVVDALSAAEPDIKTSHESNPPLVAR
jgi:response regulator RpfG family c-di-GMP phosphodiesterase